MLTVVRTGQRHFAEIIRDYVKRIIHRDDRWAERLRLPAYAKAEVTVDPRQAFGQPLVLHGGARVEDLVDRFQAGDPGRRLRVGEQMSWWRPERDRTRHSSRSGRRNALRQAR